MAKHAVAKKTRAERNNQAMDKATRVFFLGCFSEIFLLNIRRYYINGTLSQVLTWDTILKGITIAAFLITVGLGLFMVQKKRKAEKLNYLPWFTAFTGFLCLSSALVTWNMSFTTLLFIAVPVAMLLGIVWILYDRVSALALTFLGVALMALWLYRTVGVGSGLAVVGKAVMALFVVIMILAVVFARAKKIGFLANAMDLKPIYISAGCGALFVGAALLYYPCTYYAMWILAMIVFALAVYYTVKQL